MKWANNPLADYSRHSALRDRLAGVMTYFADVFRYQSLYSKKAMLSSSLANRLLN